MCSWGGIIYRIYEYLLVENGVKKKLVENSIWKIPSFRSGPVTRLQAVVFYICTRIFEFIAYSVYLNLVLTSPRSTPGGQINVLVFLVCKTFIVNISLFVTSLT